MRHPVLAALIAAMVLLAGCAGSTTADTAAASNAGAVATTPVPAPTSANTGTSSTAPSRTTPTAPVAQASPTGIPGRSKPAPPMSTQLPPERVPDTGAPPRLDASCRTSADCAVKNVGNCCGAMPACVNRNSATNPEAVKAQCARRGMMSTCGFKDVQACTCVAGTCQDSGGAESVAQ